MLHPLRLIVMIIDLGVIAFAGWLWFFRPHEEGTLWLCLALVGFALVGFLPYVVAPLFKMVARRKVDRRDA